MTEFNESMSIIKNPRSMRDVSRIRFSVFDYARRAEDREFEKPTQRYIDRFQRLQHEFQFPEGCDRGVVHLPDWLNAKDTFHDSYSEIQDFWNEFIGERGFEGLVMHTDDDKLYKIKFRDTLDAVIIAFRMGGSSRPACQTCGVKFDGFWLRKLVKDGATERSKWFDHDGRLKDRGKHDIWVKKLSMCPFCGGSVTNTKGPVLGAKIALMTADGGLVDIADGAQISSISPILDQLNPLYEGEGYLWVKPEVVIEVSYQQLYIDRPRPLYEFDGVRYRRIGIKKAISLRPYGPRLREDKSVNPQDLRLEQVNYFVDRVKGIQKKWHDATHL
jgi:hypothetical protein